ncbi:MAG: HPr(Ser) kinase/phosphatase [Longimicrobiales bacterium]|nr:HPr(Ser) kinase/phosphatase [Longimicrobiales bacterium]
MNFIGPESLGTLSVQELLEQKRTTLDLELLTPGIDLDRRIEDSDISSPGLALAGYTQRVPEGRMQVFGETEITYLRSLSESERHERLRGLFAFEIPAIFVTKGQDVPPVMIELATEAGIPIFCSSRSTKAFYERIKPFLATVIAPQTTLHGSLADVYGVGLLFVGPSGVGKSECVLDLVERGHRLVADDVVFARRFGHDVILARGHERQHHHMEIRGVGIIDIPRLFGIRAIRQQKRIEVVVRLEHWGEDRVYSRTGLEEDTESILGVDLPAMTIPLNPGKNITVISEVLAMNHLLKYTGIRSAAAFDESIKESMRPVREYLEGDFE